MKTITLHNYEEYIIDYIDGTLSTEDVADLLLFVEQHPTIKAELELLTATALPTIVEPIIYTNKHALKKEITYTNETIIAYLSNELNANETNAFTAELATNATLQQEVNLFKPTFLVADDTLVYDNKNKLKRNNKIVWLYTYAAAASVVVLLLLYNVYNADTTNVTKEVAQNKVHTVIPITTIDSTNIIRPIQKNRMDKPINTTKKTIVPSVNNNSVLPTTQNEITLITTPITAKDTLNTIEDNSTYITYKLPQNSNITTIMGNGVDESATNKPLAMVLKNRLFKKLGITQKQSIDGALVAYELKVGELEFSKTIAQK
ncbi:MAG: hypothetical protein ABL940_07250 [Bacteroidia bacterium]